MADSNAFPTELDDVARCRICGCTEDDPCLGGCSWVLDPTDMSGDLCSACLPAARREARAEASDGR